MTAHPGTLGLLDRAKRLIDESNPPDHSPLTTASRDIREARAAIAELIEAALDADALLQAYRGEHPTTKALSAALARCGGSK